MKGLLISMSIMIPTDILAQTVHGLDMADPYNAHIAASSACGRMGIEQNLRDPQLIIGVLETQTEDGVTTVTSQSTTHLDGPVISAVLVIYEDGATEYECSHMFQASADQTNEVWGIMSGTIAYHSTAGFARNLSSEMGEDSLSLTQCAYFDAIEVGMVGLFTQSYVRHAEDQITVTSALTLSDDQTPPCEPNPR